MPKGAYIGIDNIAHKIKKGYIGIDGVARKIKKAYIGIGGVARPCWSGGELVYYGQLTPLSVARYELCATHVGDYALFGGGWNHSSRSYNVDVYDSSLIKSNADSLKYGYGISFTATHTDYHAVFRNGEGIFIYNNYLTQTIIMVDTRNSIISSCVGNYVLFSDNHTLECFNTSFMLVSSITFQKSKSAATHVGEYTLFGGGEDNDALYAFNTSLTQINSTSLSIGRVRLAATHVGDYALFGGGASSYSSTDDGGTPQSIVDAYDKFLTRTIAESLSAPRYGLTATHVGDYALFGGGVDGGAYTNFNMYNNVDSYDTYLSRTITTGLSIPKMNLAATHVGDYALFGGGKSSNYAGTSLSSVDAYTII